MAAFIPAAAHAVSTVAPTASDVVAAFAAQATRVGLLVLLQAYAAPFTWLVVR